MNPGARTQPRMREARSPSSRLRRAQSRSMVCSPGEGFVVAATMRARLSVELFSDALTHDA